MIIGGRKYIIMGADRWYAYHSQMAIKMIIQVMDDHEIECWGLGDPTIFIRNANPLKLY